MKNFLSLFGLCAFCALNQTSKAQQPPSPAGIGGSVSNIFGAIDERTNLFAPSEVEIRLGGVYSQKDNAAATLIAAEYWGVGTENLGLGAEVISFTDKTAAAFPYVTYRKTLGNVAASVFVGGGWDFDIEEPIGVAGGRLEYRTSKHVGIFTSVSYAIESRDRGLITGAGISYSFGPKHPVGTGRRTRQTSSTYQSINLQKWSEQSHIESSGA